MNKTQDKSTIFLQDHKRQKGEDYQEIQKLYRMCEKNKPSKNEEFSKQNLQSLIQEVAKRNDRNIKILNESDINDDADQRLVNFLKVYQEKQFDDSKSYPNSRRNHFYFIKQLIIEEMNYKEIKLLVNQDKNLKTIKSIKLPQVKTNNYEVQDLTKAKVNKVEKKIYNALKEFEPKKRKRQTPVVKVKKIKSKSPKKYNSNLSFQDNNELVEDQETNKKQNQTKQNNENLLDPFGTQQTLQKKVASQKRFDLNKDEYDYALDTNAHNPTELIQEVKIRNSIKDNLLRNSCDMSQAFKQINQPTFDPNQSFGESSQKVIALEDNMSDNLDALHKNVLAVDRKITNVQEHEDSVKEKYGDKSDNDSFSDNVSNDDLKKQIKQQNKQSDIKDDSFIEKPITANTSMLSDDLKENQNILNEQQNDQKTPSISSLNQQKQKDVQNKEDQQKNEKQSTNHTQQLSTNKSEKSQKNENNQSFQNDDEKQIEYQNMSPNQSFDNDRSKSPTFMGTNTQFQDHDSNSKQENLLNNKNLEDKLSDVKEDNKSDDNQSR